MKTYFRHLNKGPPKSQYQFKCMLYLEYVHQFTLPSDSPFLWQCIFSNIELPYSYAEEQLCSALQYAADKLFGSDSLQFME